MESRDLIKKQMFKLRRISQAAQLAPFAYVALYVVALALYLFVPDDVMSTLDTMFYVSPTVVAINLVQSRILGLCAWHRAACLLPLAPQVNILIDRYVYEFSESAETAHLCLVLIMSILILISAYNVFFGKKRKRYSH